MQACCSRWYLTWNWRVVYPGRAPTCKGWVFSSRYLLVALIEIIQLLYVYRFKSGIFWGSDKALATPRLASLMGLSSHFPTSISNLFTRGPPGPGVVYDTPNYKKWKFRLQASGFRLSVLARPLFWSFPPAESLNRLILLTRRIEKSRMFVGCFDSLSFLLC